MSKVIWRIDELIERGQSPEAATSIAIAEQLERIADALEKQNVGIELQKDFLQIDGREFGRLVRINCRKEDER